MVVASSLAAAVAVTWPLVTTLERTHDMYDAVVQAWTIDWVQHALGHPVRVFDANMFAPQPDTLAYSDSLIGIAVPMLPLRWLGLSPIEVFNVALIVGSAVTAAAAYLFGRIAARSRIVGSVTAVAFAFGPLGTTHLGHVQSVWRAGIPLAAVATWVLADRAGRGASTWPPAAALAGVLVWQATVSFHPFAYALVVVAVVLVARWRALVWRGAVAAAAGLVAAGAGALVVAQPYLDNRARFDDFEYGLHTLAGYRVDFGAVDPRLLIWGDLLGKGDGWPAFGGSSFPGVVLLALGAVGLVAGWRDRSRRLVTVAAGLLTAVGAVLALGADDRGWRQYLPYRWLYEVVPGWRALRATDRAWFIGILGLGLLAGIGARAGARALARRTRADAARVVVASVALVAMVGVLAEGYAPWTDLPRPRVRAVDRALAALEASGGVVYLPGNATGTKELDLSYFRQPDYMYRATVHHRQMPNGFSSFVPPSYTRVFAALLDLPADSALATLRRIGVRYVVVSRPAGAWTALERPADARPLQLVGRYGADLLYEVPTARA